MPLLLIVASLNREKGQVKLILIMWLWLTSQGRKRSKGLTQACYTHHYILTSDLAWRRSQERKTPCKGVAKSRSHLTVIILSLFFSSKRGRPAGNQLENFARWKKEMPPVSIKLSQTCLIGEQGAQCSFEILTIWPLHAQCTRRPKYSLGMLPLSRIASWGMEDTCGSLRTWLHSCIALVHECMACSLASSMLLRKTKNT